MMSVTVGRLPDGVMAVLVVLGVGLAFLVSGSRARADTIVRGGLTPQGMAVDGSGDVFIADSYHHRVVVEKPNGSGGYTQRVVDAGLHSPYGVAVDRVRGPVHRRHGPRPGGRARGGSPDGVCSPAPRARVR